MTEAGHSHATARHVTGGSAEGPILACKEGLSFWGGVDPETADIVDIHHPNHGQCVSGRILLMPTSRGSCSGSGVLLELALTGKAPAALIFTEGEEILTLGALVAECIFDVPVPVLSLPRPDYDRLAATRQATIAEGRLTGDGIDIPLERSGLDDLALTARDRAILNGEAGPAAAKAMEIVCRMAAAQGAHGLMDVSRGHIDGCILAHSANLIFAEKMAAMGARITIPTTINAISVDRENWRAQSVPERFGHRASRLADAYVAMGAHPTFTCAPYLLGDAPGHGECIGWSESNAVIYANSVLGARTAKHPDYLDLCIAITGRAPRTAIYSSQGRAPRRIIDVQMPGRETDECFWPLLGWTAGRLSPDRIPLITGLEGATPDPDDLKALCAAFGTTSGAPMLHIAGHTPEAGLPPTADADRRAVTLTDLHAAWKELNGNARQIDLVAIGSPHASLSELRRIDALIAGRKRHSGTAMIVTVGRDTLSLARADGVAKALDDAGVRLLPDLCWCSMTEPVFPPDSRVLMTNSGKYAHYASGLSGRMVSFGGLADCVEAAMTGRAPDSPPAWLCT